MRKSAVAVAFCLVFAAGALLAEQAVDPRVEIDAISIPRLINYQGKLTDANGEPLTGTYNFSLAIFNAATGGTQFWSEAHSGVVVADGIFNIVLGSSNPIVNLPQGPHCWLQITVNGVTMSPRTRLVSVPFAFNSDDALKLDGLPSNEYARAIHYHAASHVTSGYFPVARGGTGRDALDANRLLLGNGTSPVVSFPAGTTGQFLRSGGFGNAPTWETVQLEFMPFGTLHIQNNITLSHNQRITISVHVTSGLPFELGDIVRIGFPTHPHGDYPNWPEGIVVANSGYVMKPDTAFVSLWNMSGTSRTIPAGYYPGQLYIKYHGTDGRATAEEPVQMGVGTVVFSGPETGQDE